MLFFRRSCLGLELSDSLLKIVELQRWWGPPRLKQVIIHPLVPIWSAEEGWTEKEELIQSIQEALAEGRLGTRKVRLSLSNRHVITQKWKVPEMNRQRMRRWIQRKVLPEWQHPCGENPLFDFQPTHHVWEDGDRQEVAVSIVSRSYVEELIQIMRWCGLNPVAVDLAALHSRRWLDYCVSSTASRLALIHVHADGFEISYVQEGILHAGTYFSMPMRKYRQQNGGTAGADPLRPILETPDEITRYGQTMIKMMKTSGAPWLGKQIWSPNVQWVLSGEGVHFPVLREWLMEQGAPSVVVADSPEAIMPEEMSDLSASRLGPALTVPLGAALAGVKAG
jgi:type IV pilus assembly protein PilM